MSEQGRSAQSGSGQADRVVGVTSYCFHDFNPFVAYRNVPRAGVRYVDVPASVSGGYFVPELMDESAIQQLRERQASLGVSPVIVGAYADFLNPRHVAALLRRITFARSLGVNVVISDSTRNLDPTRDERRRLVNAMRYAGDFAADHGVRLGIETHLGLTHSGALVADLLDDVDHPAVGVTYDTGNIYFYNDDANPVEDIRRVADRVVAVHLKDTSGGKGDWASFCDLGDGRVDFPAIIRALDAVGFSGPFAIELEATPGQDANRGDCLRSVQRSVSYLRRIGVLPPE